MEKYLNKKVIIRGYVEGILISVNKDTRLMIVKTDGEENDEYSINAILTGSITFVDEKLQSSAIKDFKTL